MASEATPTMMSRKNAVPTNVVVYQGRQMPARIDPEARLPYVIEMLSAAFSTKEHHITLCLRDPNELLVTQSNLPARVSEKVAFKLGPSPATEALLVAQALKSASTLPSMESNLALSTVATSTDMPLKMALFTLQKHVKEGDFAVEFMLKGGMSTLARIAERDVGGLSGNSLAYALQGVRGILEYESAWLHLTDRFIDRILTILVTATQPNVLRPATAIARKLAVGHGRQSGLSKQTFGTPHAALEGFSQRLSSGELDLDRDYDSVAHFGFDALWDRMQLLRVEGSTYDGARGVFNVVAQRLEGTGDLELIAQSLGFINACLRSSHRQHSEHFESLVAMLESLSVRRLISRLMPTSSANVITPHIQFFQARYLTILATQFSRSVQPIRNTQHDKMLDDIWQSAHLGSDSIPPGRASVPGSSHSIQRHAAGWRRLGLETEQEGTIATLETSLFSEGGELTLECLHHFCTQQEHLPALLLAQEAQLPEKRCPIGPASAECVKILCDHYKVFQPSPRSPPYFQLFLLNFTRIHQFLMKFFLRMWQESASSRHDFDKIGLLVQKQVAWSLTDEANKSWLDLERDCLEADYQTIRDRQMELMEKEDGMMTRQVVVELRNKLALESYDVVAEQRIGCMLQGAWFNAARVVVPDIQPFTRASTEKPFRFLRLLPNRHTIAWADFAVRTATAPTPDALRDHIELSNVVDVRCETSSAIKSRSPNLASRLSFSIMSDSNMSLLDIDAVHAAQLAEWTDGIRVLRGESSMAADDSLSYAHVLTELALRVRLLDITGDGIELPQLAPIGPAPRDVDFWYAS